MRLILGDRDFVLGVGEAAEFDTRLPHWFGSTGALCVFGDAFHPEGHPAASGYERRVVTTLSQSTVSSLDSPTTVTSSGSQATMDL